MIELPEIANVDILIFGATSAAVSFALSANDEGSSVYLVSPKPYLGDDICSLFRFWPNATKGHALSDSIFNDIGSPPTPMHVKFTLEQQLLDRGIPFLFNSFAAGILKTEDGLIGGAAIANRSGLQAIRARLVVDASIDGQILKQAGSTRAKTYSGLNSVEFSTLSYGKGERASGLDKVHSLPGYSTSEYELSACRYSLKVDFGDGGSIAIADALCESVERCWTRKEYSHQSAILPVVPICDSLPTVDQLTVMKGLVGLTESLACDQGEEFVFTNPCSAMGLAESVAKKYSENLPDTVDAPLTVFCNDSVSLDGYDLKVLRNALRPGERACKGVQFDDSKIPVLGVFDVVVVGGGTAGAPASISASRAGAKTLAIELTSGLGGVGTIGQIARYWHGNRVGFTSEIDAGVRALEFRDEFLKERDDSWSIAAKSAWYLQMGRAEGCHYWFNTVCAGVLMDDDSVKGILVAGPFGYGIVKASSVVDCTGCADIPAIAGAPTKVISSQHLAVQGTGLAGVQPGREYNNSDHTFSDDTDIVDTTYTLAAAKVKFKDDFDCGQLIDSRERRQILGDYSIDALDILYNHRYHDTICVATSNFDSHGFTVDPAFMLYPSDKKVSLWADIPLRCMLPQNIDGVLVTGLALSAHRDALPVVRMQADVQNQGYAAGFIAALSAQKQKPVRDLDVREIQKHLVDMGSLPQRVLDESDSFPVAEATISHAVDKYWDHLKGAALILHDERSIPYLLTEYKSIHGDLSPKSIRFAQYLAFHGLPDGMEELIKFLSLNNWDKGWSFRGMHQFGMTISEIDKVIIALGLIGDGSAWRVIIEKVWQLPEATEFSHFRALTMCCESLYSRHASVEIGAALIALVNRPMVRGHAHVSFQKVKSELTEDINENKTRDSALREIHLARALYACGDPDGIGSEILSEYAKDVRGHFARHARAILRAE